MRIEGIKLPEALELGAKWNLEVRHDIYTRGTPWPGSSTRMADAGKRRRPSSKALALHTHDPLLLVSCRHDLPRPGPGFRRG
jgi:hypothetical protein